MKYSDPESQHISEALMRLSFILKTEGSFGRSEFAIGQEKLLKRIGLIDDKGRNKARAKETLNVYITKLINNGTIESEEKKGDKRIVKFPPKEQKK